MKLLNLFSKKGQALPQVLVTFLVVVIIMGVIGITITYMGDIVSDVKDDQTSGSVAEQIANESLNVQLDIAEKQDSVASVAIAGIIIAVLLVSFGAFLFGRALRG